MTYQLTDRELTALRMIADGKVPKQLARDMGCSPNTIKDRLKMIRIKLGGTTTTHAVSIAHRKGIL